MEKTNGKGMLVTLNFEKNGTKYKIERGRSPNVLKFFIDEQEKEITQETENLDQNEAQEQE